MANKHGVLVLQGRDHRNQFLESLRLLRDIPDVTLRRRDTYCEPTINTVWVRKFGPIGVVQLWFETDEETLGYLTTRLPHKQVDRALREANGELAQEPEYESPMLVITEAAPPGHLDPTIEHQVWAGYRKELAAEPSGSAAQRDHRLQRFASILATYPGVELAQYDSARCINPATEKPSLYQVFRLFDHRRRGPEWLRRQVIEAQAMLAEGGDADAPGSMFGLERSNDSGEVESYLDKMLSQHRHLTPAPLDRYLYLVVHCTDNQGLFADLSAFMQSESNRGGVIASRKIYLGACRGMGNQGVVLLATRADNNSDAGEAVLNRKLHQFMEARRRNLGTYSRRHTDGALTIYDARVFGSPEAPGMVAARERGYGRLLVRAHHKEDKPGLMLNICETVARHGGPDPNYFLADGYSRREPAVSYGVFELAMGLVVSAEHGEQLHIELGKRMQGDGWDGVQIRWEAFRDPTERN